MIADTYLVCPVCKKLPMDIPSGTDLDPTVTIAWTCYSGHTWISAWRGLAGNYEHARLQPDYYKFMLANVDPQKPTQIVEPDPNAAGGRDPRVP